MVVESLSLEEYGPVPHVSPEVGYGVSAVTSARLGLQHPGAVGGGARLAQLLAPGLITNRWPYSHLKYIDENSKSFKDLHRFDINEINHTVFPLGRRHRLEQTRTPRQDFLRMLTLWLLVFLMAQPLE